MAMIKRLGLALAFNPMSQTGYRHDSARSTLRMADGAFYIALSISLTFY